jgi:molybdate transport system substrate-binding protein
MKKILRHFIKDKSIMNKVFKKILLLSICYTNLSYAANEYQFYSAAGIKLPIIALSQKMEAAYPALKIINDFDTAGAAEKKFIADTNSACLITTKVRIDKDLQGGILKGDPPNALVDTLAGIAFSGHPKPQINSTEDLKRVLLEVNRIAFSDPSKGATVGLHFISVLKKLDIEKEILQKSVIADDGIQTMKLIMEKKVDIGITQVSEIVQADANTLVGPFPKEFELSSRYAIWCRNPQDAVIRRWLELLKSQEGEKSFIKYGLRPVISERLKQ